MLKLEKNNVKLINYNHEIGNNILEFKISGPNINYIVVNTIRRTILSDIPIYAFNQFKFNKNDSVFHNNYLKLRLKQLPIFGIENKIDFYDSTYNLNTNENKNNIDDNIEDNDEDNEIDYNVTNNIKFNSLKQLTMYINYKNKSNDIITVSTNNAKFYYNEKQINIPYPVPIPIIKLQPMQEIAFSVLLILVLNLLILFIVLYLLLIIKKLIIMNLISV